MHLIVLTVHKSVPILWKRFNSISRTRPVYRLIPTASSSMWWRYSTRVDAGTSTWLQAEARTDFHAETALEAVIHFLSRYGRPRRMTFDRDSRWVGSHSLRHFPSAFCRFLLCLDIQPNICPPRRPDKNAYVERLHRTLNQECLQIRLPTTLGEVREATEEFLQHYNHERPHQGTACSNRPPHTAFPNLPILPPVPEQVNPDRWLETIHGQAFARKVGADGSVDVDDEHDYISQAYASQQVVLFVNAPEKTFGVWLDGRVIKSVPIKGLGDREMGWEDSVAFMKQQARSEERRLLEKQHRMRQLSLGI
jgi:Integrase core domain